MRMIVGAMDGSTSVGVDRAWNTLRTKECGVVGTKSVAKVID